MNDVNPPLAPLGMIIDPVCSLVFEAETDEEDLMRRPPAGPLFSWPLIGWSVLQVYGFGLPWHAGRRSARFGVFSA